VTTEATDTAGPGAIRDVAGEIRAELARKRMSQRELALCLGMGPVALSRRLRGVVRLSVPELAEIARVLDAPVSQFTDPRPRHPVPTGTTS